MSEPGGPQARLRALRDDYLKALPEKMTHLRQAIDGLQSEVPDTERLNRARHIAHGLTGSGASFGFESISERARNLEVLLDRHHTAATSVSPLSLEMLHRAFRDLKIACDLATEGG